RPKWRLNAQEYAVIPNDGANLLDVGQECVAGILRKRQLRPTSALALDAQQGTAPIYVYRSWHTSPARSPRRARRRMMARSRSPVGVATEQDATIRSTAAGLMNRGRAASRRRGAKGTAWTSSVRHAPLAARNLRYARSTVTVSRTDLCERFTG